MFSKINKTKGFTLIELMTVILIISLISAIVFASLKGARDKAMLTKAVEELKSVQQAVEMYKNQFGLYPGNIDEVYDDDNSHILNLNSNWNDFINTSLKNNKFISQVPNSPNYPNNCVDHDSCVNNGYITGYVYYNPLPDYYFICDGQKVDNYVLYIAANVKKINLPRLHYQSGVSLLNPVTWQPGIDSLPYVYCLSM